MVLVYTTYMLEKVLYWAGGFIDADGSLYVWARSGRSVARGLRERYYSPVVSGANTDPRPIHLLHSLFGGQLWHQKRSANQLKDKPNAQDYWAWKIVGAGAGATAKLLVPMLVRKQKQAQLLQDWPYMKSGPNPKGNDAIYAQQQKLTEQLVKLNRRGRE